MSTFITVIIILTCVLLILVILIQSPKGGGLSSEFSSSNQFMGVRKTADFLEKSTWTLAIVLLSLSLISSAVMVTKPAATESTLQEKYEEMPEPIQTVPNFPQNIPAPESNE